MAVLIIGIGLLVGREEVSGRGAATPLTPGAAALDLECGPGEQTLVAEAVQGEASLERTGTPRALVRDFLRSYPRRLLTLRFARLAAGDLAHFVAERDGARVASVLVASPDPAPRVEGAAACASLLEEPGQ